jgi:hypothetical protein
MKSWKLITIITLAVIGVALVTTVAFASAYNPYRSMTPTQGFSGGMMGNWNTYTGPTQANQQTPNGYGGRGCRGLGVGYVAPSTTANTTATPVTLEQAKQIAQRYVTALNNPDLKVTEVEEYTSNFYVQVHESSTGNGAFELLVDRYTGNVYPEMGPNMMWNTKYSAHTGMMGMFNGLSGMMGFQRTTSTPMTVTAEQAKANAQQFLNANFAGTTVGDTTAFYGYYHVEVLSEGKLYGMLSVNGYTGQVWYHNWHGSFVQEAEIS